MEKGKIRGTAGVFMPIIGYLGDQPWLANFPHLISTDIHMIFLVLKLARYIACVAAARKQHAVAGEMHETQTDWWRQYLDSYLN